MAEALALGASIIAVIQIAESVIGLCKFWLETVQDGPSDIRSILTETSMLKSILENVELLISSSVNKSTMLDRLSGADGPIQGCRTIMIKIEKLFPAGYFPSNDRTSKSKKVKATLAHLAWPWKAEKAKKLVEEISRVKMTLNLTLTVQSNHDIGEVKVETRAIQASLSATQRHKIYDWLEMTDPTPLHHRACKQYEPKTGDWMLRSEEWEDWLHGTTRCLWIHGIPGAGKTILASYLIKATKTHTPTLRKCGFAYYYCSFTHNQDEAEPFLRWVINDLCRQAKAVPPCLDELYERGGTPSLEELMDILVAVTGYFEQIFLTIDAIDESLEPRENLLSILRRLASDSQLHKIKLLATSREYVEIERTMEPVSAPVSMRNPLLDEDIELYVKLKLDRSQRFKHWPSELLVEALENLSAKAMGICIGEPTKDPGRNVDETYERIFQDIPEENRHAVQFALKWIYFHQDIHNHQDISTPILIGAIERSVYETTASKHCYFLDEEQLRELCGCLVTVTPKSSHCSQKFSTVSFAHFTVWEFVNSPRILQSHTASFHVETQAATAELTRVVLRTALAAGGNYRSIDGFGGIQPALDESFDIYCALQSSIFLSAFSGKISKQEDLTHLAFDLLDHSRTHFASLQAVIFSVILDAPAMQTPASWPLFAQIEWSAASTCPEASILAKLLLLDCIHYALVPKFMEHIDVQRVLRTEWNIPKIQLITSLQRGHTSCYRFQGSIIELFAQMGLVGRDQLEFLLNLGVCHNPSEVLLSYLAAEDDEFERGEYGVLLKILELGADVNYSRFVVTPLQIAIHTKNINTARILLESGANVRYTGNTYGKKWEDGTLLSRFNDMGGLSALDICIHLEPGEHMDRAEELLLGEEVETLSDNESSEEGTSSEEGSLSDGTDVDA